MGNFFQNLLTLFRQPGGFCKDLKVELLRYANRERLSARVQEAVVGGRFCHLWIKLAKNRYNTKCSSSSISSILSSKASTLYMISLGLYGLKLLS